MKIKILLLTLTLTLCAFTRGQTNSPPQTNNAVDTYALLAPFVILVPATGYSAVSEDVETVSLRHHIPHYYGNGYRGGYNAYSGFGGGFGAGPTYRLRNNGGLVLQGSRGTSPIVPSTAVGPPYGQLRSGAPVLRSQNRSYRVAPSSGQGPIVGQRRSGAPILRGSR